MALIVEDGTGIADAESPNTIEELDTFHAGRAGSEAWGEATLPIKERAAREAALLMESRWAPRLLAGPRTGTQALAIPCVGIAGVNGRPISSARIAALWKQAHAELALRALVGALFADQERGGQLQSYSFSSQPAGLDSFSMSKSYATGAPIETAYPIIDAILAPILMSGGRLVLA